MQEGFITHVKTAAEIEETKTRRKVKLSNYINIFVNDNDRVIFECIQMHTVDFDFHLHSFEVMFPEHEIVLYVYQDSLLSFIPNHMTIASYGIAFKLCNTKSAFLTEM